MQLLQMLHSLLETLARIPDVQGDTLQFKSEAGTRFEIVTIVFGIKNRKLFIILEYHYTIVIANTDSN